MVLKQNFSNRKEPIRGCTACRGCSVINRCIFDDDPVNAVLKAEKADGFAWFSCALWRSIRQY